MHCSTGQRQAATHLLHGRLSQLCCRHPAAAAGAAAAREDERQHGFSQRRRCRCPARNGLAVATARQVVPLRKQKHPFQGCAYPSYRQLREPLTNEPRSWLILQAFGQDTAPLQQCGLHTAARTSAHTLHMPSSSESANLSTLSQSRQLAGQATSQAKGGPVADMPKPPGQAEQPKTSECAPGAQFSWVSSRQCTCMHGSLFALHHHQVTFLSVPI